MNQLVRKCAVRANIPSAPPIKTVYKIFVEWTSAYTTCSKKRWALAVETQRLATEQKKLSLNKDIMQYRDSLEKAQKSYNDLFHQWDTLAGTLHSLKVADPSRSVESLKLHSFANALHEEEAKIIKLQNRIQETSAHLEEISKLSLFQKVKALFD